MIETSAFVPGHGPGLKRVRVCCQMFANALQSGTDNEGYSSLVYLLDDEGGWAMGVALPQPFHCPWCGADPDPKMVR